MENSAQAGHASTDDTKKYLKLESGNKEVGVLLLINTATLHVTSIISGGDDYSKLSEEEKKNHRVVDPSEFMSWFCDYMGDSDSSQGSVQYAVDLLQAVKPFLGLNKSINISR